MSRTDNLKTDNLKIVRYPDPVLKKKCEEVTAFGPDLADLALRMFDLMKEARGIGLAAPQVGLPVRLFVYNVTGNEADNHLCVNPQLLDLEDAADDDEGCLSLPGVTVNMRRAISLTLKAQDAEGNWYERKGDNLLARVWQHETDHLNGKLIIDSMSPSDEVANRRAIRKLEDEFKAESRRR